jgi:pimeloyl-ACP methyl ester carboxylesterase
VPFVNIAPPDGPEIAYRDAGAGPLTVVLSHGFMLDQTMFEPQVAAIAKEYRVITWDARGHGATRSDHEPFDQWDLARDLLALLDRLEIERAVFGGLSQGGAVTLSAALLDPSRIQALILMSTTARAPDGAASAALRALGDAWQQHGATTELCNMFSRMVLGQDDAAPWVQKWKDLSAEQFSYRFDAVLRGQDLSSQLGEISAPTLVIHGANDVGLPVVQAEQMARDIPGSGAAVIIPAAPHACSMTHPDEVNRAVLRFLEGL